MKIDLEKFKAERLRAEQRKKWNLYHVGDYIRMEKNEEKLKKLELKFTMKQEKWECILKNMEILNSGCWEWTGMLSDSGYGKIHYEKKLWRAHRLSYLLAFGEIPKGLFICHTCDNPKCVNPMHLFAGTHEQNMKDCVEKGRSKSFNQSFVPTTAIPKEKVSQIKHDIRAAFFSIAVKHGLSVDSVKKIGSGRKYPGVS